MGKHRIIPILLRGYIEQVGKDDFFAICITLNICARGKSLEDAHRQLDEAIKLYAESIEDDPKKWIPRRAPFYHLWRYFLLWLRMHIRLFFPPYEVQLLYRTAPVC